MSYAPIERVEKLEREFNKLEQHIKDTLYLLNKLTENVSKIATKINSFEQIIRQTPRLPTGGQG